MNLNTPTATKLVGGLSLLVVAALGWVLALGPKTDDLAQTRETITSTRDQNTMLAGQLAALVKQRDELGRTRAEARALAKKFPPTADQPGLFEEVTRAAVDAGIGPKGVTTLAPTPPTVGDPSTAGTTPSTTTGTTAGTTPPATTAAAPAIGALLARQSVSVSVTGTYDETQRLLENLEHMPRAYLVTGLTLAGDAASGQYTTTITGEMFVMSPVKDPGKSVDLADTTG